MKKNKIAYVINHPSFFCSHFLPLALEAEKKGFEISVFCGKGGSKKMESEAEKILKKKKINVNKFKYQPGIGNIFNEIISFINIIFKIKKYNPDIIHGITIKGILHSCLYSFIFKPKKLICNITGMGHLFTNKLNFKENLLKLVVLATIRLSFLLKKSILILENKDDLNYFVNKLQIKKNKIIKINGAGVNLNKFKYIESLKKNIVLLPARVLVEKGILEFIEASKSLSLKYSKWKFLVAGALDYRKNSKNNKLLKKVNLYKYKNIKFLGYKKNISNLFNQSSIVCLPSYREGFPKSLIEASSSGCAIVTTNVPGCREAVKNKINGFLCKVKNANSLKKKIEEIMVNKKLRIKFSKNSRKIAIKNYDIKRFIKINIEQYEI